MPSGDKVSLNFPRERAPLTSMPFPESPIPVVMTRQDSYTTISRLLRAASIEHRSPGTPSPEGAGQLKSIVQRLEDIDAESRELLKKLFSMLEKDTKLERYIWKRLEDPKVSRMWELVEQVLDTHRGDETLHLQQMLGSESGGSSTDGGWFDATSGHGGSSSDSGSASRRYADLSRFHKLTSEKGLKMYDQEDMTIETNIGNWRYMMETGDGDDLKLHRFKFRTLDPARVDSGEVQPPNDQTKHKGGSG